MRAQISLTSAWCQVVNYFTINHKIFYDCVGFNRNRKVSEGLPPFISLLSQNDAGDPDNSNTFEIIEEESWKGQSKIYGPSGQQSFVSYLSYREYHWIYIIQIQGTRNIQKKITRERKEVFPGYEKVVQDRNQMTVDDVLKEQDELQNEEEEDTSIVIFLQQLSWESL